MQFTKEYQNYLLETIALVKTLVIKREDTCDRMNSLVALKFGENSIDRNNPASWRYYMNLAGNYHSSDKMMTVTSLDTLKTIEFTKDNLRTHTATRQAYQSGTEFHRELVSRYPDQEALVMGILYPADAAQAINAPMGTIVSYNKKLVEEQEITLIADLQEWIYRYMTRWHVKAFTLSDTLYPAAQHAGLMLNIVPKILNLRLRRCKTFEAHSFHIEQYLASHNGMDLYLPYMTLKQKLFFYRNIAYIERNQGKAHVFKWLIQKVLTDRYIPLMDYSCRHMSDFDEDYKPEILFRKRPLNTQYNIPEKNYFSTDELLTKEYPTAKDNKTYALENRLKIEEKFKNSPSSVIQTKDLESAMIDYTDAVPEPTVEILMKHWGYMASVGMYDCFVQIKDHVTGTWKNISVRDAFIFANYLSLKSYGIECTTVPVFTANRVQKLIKPSKTEIESVVDMKVMNDGDVAQWLIDNQPEMPRCYSRNAFYEFCDAVFKASNRHWYMVSRTEDWVMRMFADNMTNQMYCDGIVRFEDSGMDMQKWLLQRNLSAVRDYSKEDLAKYALGIFVSATGFNIATAKSAENIQKAMLGIMVQLSSYSVQYLQDINSSKIKPLGWAATRVGQVKSSGVSTIYLEVPLNLLEVSGTEYSRHDMDLVVVHDLSFKMKTRPSKQLIGIDTELDIKNNFISKITADISGMVFNSDDNYQWNEKYMKLSTPERLDIPDIYTN